MVPLEPFQVEVLVFGKGLDRLHTVDLGKPLGVRDAKRLIWIVGVKRALSHCDFGDDAFSTGVECQPPPRAEAHLLDRVSTESEALAANGPPHHVEGREVAARADRRQPETRLAGCPPGVPSRFRRPRTVVRWWLGGR